MRKLMCMRQTCDERTTDAQKINEIVRAVASQDSVDLGVAKARFAGEANYSVPSLERLMRGERATEDIQTKTMAATKGRGLKFTRDQVFPLGVSKGKAKSA